MRPPAIEIRIIKPAAGMGWEYVARVKGEAVDASDGESFDHPGRALQVAIESVKAVLAVPPAPTFDEGGSHE
jgi:hypothetical protein